MLNILFTKYWTYKRSIRFDFWISSPLVLKFLSLWGLNSGLLFASEIGNLYRLQNKPQRVGESITLWSTLAVGCYIYSCLVVRMQIISRCYRMEKFSQAKIFSRILHKHRVIDARRKKIWEQTSARTSTVYYLVQ